MLAGDLSSFGVHHNPLFHSVSRYHNSQPLQQLPTAFINISQQQISTNKQITSSDCFRCLCTQKHINNKALVQRRPQFPLYVLLCSLLILFMCRSNKQAKYDAQQRDCFYHRLPVLFSFIHAQFIRVYII